MLGNVEEWTGTLWGGDLAKSDFPYPYQPDDGLRSGDDGPKSFPDAPHRAWRVFRQPTGRGQLQGRVRQDRSSRQRLPLAVGFVSFRSWHSQPRNPGPARHTKELGDLMARRTIHCEATPPPTATWQQVIVERMRTGRLVPIVGRRLGDDLAFGGH